MVRPRYEEVDFTRDCEAVQIPQGTTVTIEAGTPAVIMQDLGDSYTIQIPTLGGLYRVAGKDADALGKDAPLGPSAETDTRKPVDEALVRRVLQSVYDPEIPVNIVDLGLVYALHIEPLLTGGSKVQVQMTLTAPGCGMGQIIAADVQRRIERLPGVIRVEVEVVWEPPWNPQRISPEGRAKLGLD